MDKFQKELSLIRIIRDLRAINIYLSNKLMQDKTRFLLDQHQSNVISIDVSEESSASDDDEDDERNNKDDKETAS